MNGSADETPLKTTPSDMGKDRVVLTWNSRDLLGQTGEAKIVHGDDTYRLLLTRNNKLILVK